MSIHPVFPYYLEIGPNEKTSLSQKKCEKRLREMHFFFFFFFRKNADAIFPFLCIFDPLFFGFFVAKLSFPPPLKIERKNSGKQASKTPKAMCVIFWDKLVFLFGLSTSGLEVYFHLVFPPFIFIYLFILFLFFFQLLYLPRGGYFHQNRTWMCLPNLENLTFSIPIFRPITHPLVYQFQ